MYKKLNVCLIEAVLAIHTERGMSMTYEDLFETVRDGVRSADVSFKSGHLAVEIQIEGEAEGVFYIELKDGKLYAEPYNYNDFDCRLKVSAKNFLKLMEGSLDPVFAFTLGKLKIDGSLEKALEFKEILDAVHR